jgi:hypothetical protein
MNSHNIQPDDMVIVVFIPDAYYTDPWRPGAVGTAIRQIHLPNPVHPECRYWEVSFQGVAVIANERVLRKLDGEDRQVGCWDYCVFNAPKRARELDRVSKVMENR